MENINTQYGVVLEANASGLTQGKWGLQIENYSGWHLPK